VSKIYRFLDIRFKKYRDYEPGYESPRALEMTQLNQLNQSLLQ